MVSDDDIFAALNDEGFKLYARILKEGKGFFVKTDESSVTLVPGTQEYTLPADCTQLAHVAERVLPTDNWLSMAPESLNMSYEQQQSIWDGYIAADAYGDSAFSYNGPYLDSGQVDNAAPEADNSTELMKIRVSPQIDVTRAVQLVYTAKWIDLLDDSSVMTLPEEATSALYSLTMANLSVDMDDTRAQGYAMNGEAQAKYFLTWVRDRQIQTGPKVEPYL
jgi:hypothetical protein